MEPSGSRGPDHQPALRPPGQAITNFSKALAPAGSDIAHQILNDPCQFEGLSPVELASYAVPLAWE